MIKSTEELTGLGFRLPAEWEDHAATWLSWPHEPSDWPGKFPAIPFVYSEIIKNLASLELVKLIVPNQHSADAISHILFEAGANLDNITFIHAPTNRSWIRDYGPLFLKDKHSNKTILNLRFNAWAKYDNFNFDDDIPKFVSSNINCPLWEPKHNNIQPILEGGSIDVDGQGTLLTTEECLLSKTQERNPGFSKQDYETFFAKYLGVKKVLWLGNGIAGDDTHGHVDDIARFIAPGKVITMIEENKSDINHEPLKDNLARLKSMTDAQGNKLQVFELPMPAPVIFAGQRLPASYANFYIANGIVLVPTFNDANDRVALNLLSQLFPTRKIVGIHCVDLVLGLGTLHCLSQQQPA
jgi:agmatine deiminase